MGSLSILMPPIAFAIVLAAVLLLALALRRLSYGTRRGATGREPYACGEDIPTHMIQPNYEQFFPFAFFFTILHVVTLMVATVPAATPVTFVIAAVYVLGAGVGLVALYAR
jgi:NADH-quinone oxidoreductase subunit A